MLQAPPRRVRRPFAPLVALVGPVGLVAALCMAIGPAPALAYEDQLGASLGLGLARSPSGDRPRSGGYLEAGATLGLDDVFSLRTRLGYALHPGHDALDAQHLAFVATDLVYALDILTWVPYFGAGLTAQVWAADDADFDAGVQLIGGLDYLASRRWVFGLELRGMATFRALEGDAAYVTFGVTATRLWEL